MHLLGTLHCGAASPLPAAPLGATAGVVPVQRHPGVGTSEKLWLATAFLVPKSCSGAVFL